MIGPSSFRVPTFQVGTPTKTLCVLDRVQSRLAQIAVSRNSQLLGTTRSVEDGVPTQSVGTRVESEAASDVARSNQSERSENKMMAQEESDLPKLASPAQRALSGAGITRLDQLSKMSESELSRLHGIGPNAIKTLRLALQEKGLSFLPEERMDR